MRASTHSGPVNGQLIDRLRHAFAETAPEAPPPPGKREAAVLMLFDPARDGLPLLFVRRADHLRLHAGQIALPGGSREPGDPHLAATAVREAGEEVGLDPADVEVIGALAARLTRRSDLWLTPVAGIQRRPFTVRGDGHEVAEWFWLPLARLLAADHRAEGRDADGGEGRLVHYYEADGRTIWGVTGGIVHDLLERLGPG
jgi:8-oxo-dGTP pyrophosphatase MutT (NUDIX family)